MGTQQEIMQTLNNKVSLYSSRFIYTMLILIQFVACFSSAAVTVFSIWMIVAFFIKRISLKDFSLSKTPIQLPFLLIMCFSLLSFLKLIDLRAGAQGIWKLFYFGSLFTVATEELKDKKHLSLIITAAILGLAVASLDGIWQFYSGFDIFRHYPYNFQGGYVKQGLGFPRIRAAFPHTNIFAAYLVLFLPLAITMFLYYWNKKFKRTIYLTVAILALFCLFWTFSQGAAAGFLAALIFIAIVRRNKWIFILLACVMILAPFIMPQGIKHYIKDANSVWQVVLNRERIGNFRNAINMIMHNPALGVGVNTYSLNIEKYMIKDNSIFIGNKGYADNIYLHMAAEIGIFGLISLLWLIFKLFRYALKKYRLTEDTVLKAYLLGIIAGLAGSLINGFTESILYYPKIAVLFWFQVGVLFGIIKISDKFSLENKLKDQNLIK
jgi:putative inorganic carbon (HCO3(-)) transporter